MTNRLLAHLAQPGAFARHSPDEDGRIALFRVRDGVTLGAGLAPLAEAEALVAAGTALWQGVGAARRLIATARRREGESVERDGESPLVLDERESPLAWLHRRPGKDGRPQISAGEFAAGERFRADLTRSGILPQVTSNWDSLGGARAPGHRPRDPAAASDAVIAARQRVRRACDGLGPDLSGLAIDVCGFLKGLDQVERERGWSRRSGKVVLRLALARLATHYGLAGEATGPASGRSRQWRAEDARPSLMSG